MYFGDDLNLQIVVKMLPNATVCGDLVTRLEPCIHIVGKIGENNCGISLAVQFLLGELETLDFNGDDVVEVRPPSN